MRLPETLFRLFLQGCDEVMSGKKQKKKKKEETKKKKEENHTSKAKLTST